MARSRVTIALATVVFIAGAVVLIRGLSRSTPLSRTKQSSAERPQDTPARDVLPIDLVGLEREVTPDSVPEVIEDLRRAVFDRARAASPALAGQRGEQLAVEAAAFFTLVLDGGADELRGYLGARGAVLSEDELDEERGPSIWAYQERMLMAFRHRAVSIEHLAVRPRVRDGRALRTEPLGRREASVVRPGRYPALANLVRRNDKGVYEILGESYEVAVPIGQVFNDRETSVIMGVWFTWAPDAGRWLISRVDMYAPSEDVVLLQPPM